MVRERVCVARDGEINRSEEERRAAAPVPCAAKRRTATLSCGSDGGMGTHAHARPMCSSRVSRSDRSGCELSGRANGFW